MKKRYWYVLLTYFIIQISALLGAPLLILLGIEEVKIPGIWSLISFSVGLVIILFLLRLDMKERSLERNRSSRSEAIGWSILGIIMAFMAQYAAILIEVYLLGIEPGSENTKTIVEYAKAAPVLIIVVAIIGPILEEIVFRMIIFGSLYKRFNFWIAAIISSLVFATVHWDFEHLLVYTFMGLTFSFLYVYTKRIIVPIVAHVALNSFVMLVQVIFWDKIQEIQRIVEEMEAFIGGFF